MRTDLFGALVLEPDDDLTACFGGRFGTCDTDKMTARCINYDEARGWSCEIVDDDNAAKVEGFESEDGLRDWLMRFGVMSDD